MSSNTFVVNRNNWTLHNPCYQDKDHHLQYSSMFMYMCVSYQGSNTDGGHLRSCSNGVSDAVTQFDYLVPVGLTTPTGGRRWGEKRKGEGRGEVLMIVLASIGLCLLTHRHHCHNSSWLALDSLNCPLLYPMPNSSTRNTKLSPDTRVSCRKYSIYIMILLLDTSGFA